MKIEQIKGKKAFSSFLTGGKDIPNVPIGGYEKSTW